MCVISANVYKSSKDRSCCCCDHRIKKGEYYIRLFGMAYKGDPPYEAIECLYSLNGSKAVPVITRALDKRKIKYTVDAGGYLHLEVPRVDTNGK